MKLKPLSEVGESSQNVSLNDVKSLLGKRVTVIYKDPVSRKTITKEGTLALERSNSKFPMLLLEGISGGMYLRYVINIAEITKEEMVSRAVRAVAGVLS